MAQPKGIPKEKNIIRIDTKKAHGWQVKFEVNCQEVSKFFSDRKYNGVKYSLDEARNFRDSFIVDLKAVKIPRKPKDGYGSEDKVAGVFLVKRKSRSISGGESFYWNAQWRNSDGKKQSKAYSVLIHGYDNAHHLAIEARRKGISNRNAHEAKPKFVVPSDPDIKLWRYLDFTKFVSLLDKSAIFFVFADALNDPFEGAISAVNKSLRPSLFEKKLFPAIVNRAELRARVGINSWHMNTHESAAMWRLYAQTNEAVCIQSTYFNLRSVLPQIFKISAMNYVDYDSNYIPEYHPLMPFIFKRKSFEHERELRAIVDMEEADIALGELLGIEHTQFGIYKTVSLKKLIQRVFVAPEAPDWFFELVRSVCKSYDLADIPVVRSSLETDPFY